MRTEAELMKIWADYGKDCYKFVRENWWPLVAALKPCEAPEDLLRGLSKIRLGPNPDE